MKKFLHICVIMSFQFCLGMIPDKAYKSLFDSALRQNKAKLIRLYLPKVSQQDITDAFVFASEQGYVEVVREIVESPFFVGISIGIVLRSIKVALRKQYFGVVRIIIDGDFIHRISVFEVGYLLDFGAIYGDSFLVRKIINSHYYNDRLLNVISTEIAGQQTFIQDYAVEKALKSAAKNNHLEIVKMFMDSSRARNISDQSLRETLRLAAEYGATNVVHYLLSLPRKYGWYRQVLDLFRYDELGEIIPLLRNDLFYFFIKQNAFANIDQNLYAKILRSICGVSEIQVPGIGQELYLLINGNLEARSHFNRFMNQLKEDLFFGEILGVFVRANNHEGLRFVLTYSRSVFAQLSWFDRYLSLPHVRLDGYVKNYLFAYSALKPEYRILLRKDYFVTEIDIPSGKDHPLASIKSALNQAKDRAITFAKDIDFDRLQRDYDRALAAIGNGEYRKLALSFIDAYKEFLLGRPNDLRNLIFPVGSKRSGKGKDMARITALAPLPEHADVLTELLQSVLHRLFMKERIRSLLLALVENQGQKRFALELARKLDV